MAAITVEEQKLYTLIMDAVKKVYKDLGVSNPDKWIDGDEAMRILNITSRTTLQKLRNTGAIRFSQPEKKIILYDRDSINQYLEKHSKDTF